MKPRVLFALPGLHRVNRGAEMAFIQIALGLCERDFEVTLIGAGEELPNRPYRFIPGSMKDREAFRKRPMFPPLRTEYRWEELSFCPSLWKQFRPEEYDLTVTCSFPFVHWLLRMKGGKKRPAHVFVTENGDWCAYANNSEYKFFNCEGLVCTNPEYQERNQEKWNCALIPNGVDTSVFTPGEVDRSAYGLPADAKVVCMVSALIPSKFPMDGVRAVAGLGEDVHLLLAGKGPQDEECDALGKELLGERYHRITVPMEKMPEVYRCGDVFLHMSRDEAFGNIYIESASCGIPVVGHETPSTRWILGEHGHLLDSSNQEKLISLLKNLLEQPPSPEKKQQARDMVVTRFDWSAVCDQYAEFFRSVVSDARAI